MSKGGRYARQDGRKSSKGGSKAVKVLTIVLVILVLVVAGLLGVIVYRGTMDRLADQVPTVPVITEPAVSETVAETTESAEETTEAPTETTAPPYTASGKEIVNFLLVGQSYRAGEESRLADTLILVTVNKTTKTMTLSSFMRDTYVDLPDYMGHSCSWNKINTAYALGYVWGGNGGAMEMTAMTIKDNFGVEVDHVVEVNFDGFMEAINIIGGVDIYLTEAEADYLNKDDTWVRYDVVPNEVNRLDGMAALSYARMRKAAGDGNSDIKRTARQRTVITAVLEKVRSSSFNTLKYLLESVMGMFVTDMTNDEILTCMWEILPILSELTIETNVVPYEITGNKEIMVGDVATYALKFNAENERKRLMAIAEADNMN